MSDEASWEKIDRLERELAEKTSQLDECRQNLEACSRRNESDADLIASLQLRLGKVKEYYDRWMNDDWTGPQYADAMRELIAVDRQCQHEWVDPSNSVVQGNGWKICTKCGLFKEPDRVDGPTITTTAPDRRGPSSIGQRIPRGDWPEDAGGDVGGEECLDCGGIFIGAEGRNQCKECATAPDRQFNMANGSSIRFEGGEGTFEGCGTPQAILDANAAAANGQEPCRHGWVGHCVHCDGDAEDIAPDSLCRHHREKALEEIRRDDGFVIQPYQCDDCGRIRNETVETPTASERLRCLKCGNDTWMSTSGGDICSRCSTPSHV